MNKYNIVIGAFFLAATLCSFTICSFLRGTIFTDNERANNFYFVNQPSSAIDIYTKLLSISFKTSTKNILKLNLSLSHLKAKNYSQAIESLALIDQKNIKPLILQKKEYFLAAIYYSFLKHNRQNSLLSMIEMLVFYDLIDNCFANLDRFNDVFNLQRQEKLPERLKLSKINDFLAFDLPVKTFIALKEARKIISSLVKSPNNSERYLKAISNQLNELGIELKVKNLEQALVEIDALILKHQQTEELNETFFKAFFIDSRALLKSWQELFIKNLEAPLPKSTKKALILLLKQQLINIKIAKTGDFQDRDTTKKIQKTALKFVKYIHQLSIIEQTKNFTKLEGENCQQTLWKNFNRSLNEANLILQQAYQKINRGENCLLDQIRAYINLKKSYDLLVNPPKDSNNNNFKEVNNLHEMLLQMREIDESPNLLPPRQIEEW